MNVRQLANRIDPGQAPSRRNPTTVHSPASREGRRSFASQLERARLETLGPKISTHAWKRIQQRGISMTDAQQRTLAEAMQQLAQKGARDALLMRSDAAFVVNVPNRTVVTAIDQQEMQHRVFTQIDSAMLLGA